MFVFWVFVIAVILIAVAVFYQAKINADKIKSTAESIPDFKATQQYVGVNGLTGIFVDEDSQQVSLISNKFGNMSYRKIDYKDIIECTIVENGVSVNKTSRTSQIGGAIVGGVLFGGVGTVIGGLSGKSKTIEKVRSIDLHITVNDTSNPVHDVKFLATETTKGSFLYRAAFEQVQRWYSLISVLIKRADEEAKTITDISVPVNVSVADELGKLTKLKESGVLTDEEFENQKRKLLN